MGLPPQHLQAAIPKVAPHVEEMAGVGNDPLASQGSMQTLKGDHVGSAGIEHAARFQPQQQLLEQGSWLEHVLEHGAGQHHLEASFRVQLIEAAVDLDPGHLLDAEVDHDHLPHCPKALLRARLWSPEVRAAPGTFPSMNAMLRAQLGSAVITETDEQARERYRAQLADEGLAHHVR